MNRKQFPRVVLVSLNFLVLFLLISSVTFVVGARSRRSRGRAVSPIPPSARE